MFPQLLSIYVIKRNKNSFVKTILNIIVVLDDFNDEDSPRSFADKLCRSKGEKKKIKSPSPPPKIEPTPPPLADILYITKPIPITKNTSNKPTENEKKIEILQVEEFYGNLPELKCPKSVNVINLDTCLKAKQQNEEANNDTETNKENLTADTLSATAFSESITSAQNEVKLNNETIRNESHFLTHNEELNSRLRRKRSRNRSANATKDLEAEVEVVEIDDYPTESLNELDEIIEIVKSPKNMKKSPIIQNYGTSKQTNEDVIELGDCSTKKTKYPNSSPTVSVMSSPRFCSSKNVADDHRYRKHLKFPQNDEQHHRSQSISPTFLTQYSSRCSSTNDLRSGGGKDDVYNLKSSHSELSWGSTKLRRSVKKSFTVKNTAEKRISLKMEIIGPGFQVGFVFVNFLELRIAYDIQQNPIRSGETGSIQFLSQRIIVFYL